MNVRQARHAALKIRPVMGDRLETGARFEGESVLDTKNRRAVGYDVLSRLRKT